MNVIGFDTSTAATAVCVERGDGESFEYVPAPDELDGRPGHASELLPRIRNLMDEAQLCWDELDAVGVGVGPGAFTGLRIGVATARSLALARGLELRPVSSLRALAEGIEHPLRLPAIDARRGEVFGALYADGEERLEPAARAPDDLAEHAAGARAAGTGALHFREALEVAGATVEPDGSPAHVVRALNVCRLARRTPASSPATVLPYYLRLPDAKPR
ncbi:MAG TPA: tRNA (adenosine(37)-N6)-threonylcarbamoyltransferase complex dimerization subunit type 1 TsaB [Thermoleophilaceae bacterium]|nr:tRNA (adenosine(37)-N6)-threonylcarbamoyltransferase complex dimerization subunit type 1 TsaB [Thermoleophilaceae bacterium]